MITTKGSRPSRCIPAIAALTVTLSLAACTTPAASVAPGVPSPSAQVLAPSPAPTPSKAGAVALDKTKPVTTPGRQAHPPAWSVSVRLIGPSIAVRIFDSGGVPKWGSFHLILTVVENGPRCFVSPCSPPKPGTYVQHYDGCCTPEYIPMNLPWGGNWSVRGSVTYLGVTKSVSGSGTIP